MTTSTRPPSPPPSSAACICCGLPADELHHGQWWCYVCVGRDHHEDGPHHRSTEGERDA